MKKTKIKYVIQKCNVSYNNNIYNINLNYSSLLKKELNYIILKKLNNNLKYFYLYDLKINNNNILSGKESVENIGAKIEILSLEIINKYYNIKKIIKQEDIFKFDISGITDNKEEINIRNYFNKLNYNELLNYGNIYPLYLINKKIEINIKNIFSYFKILKLKNPIIIKSINDINKLKQDFYLNDISFYFDKNKAQRKHKYNLTILNSKLHIFNKYFKELKQYLIFNHELNNLTIKELILFEKEYKYGNYYYLNICGFEINNNNFNLIKFNNLKNTIIKIKLYKNYLLYQDNIKIPLSFIDNNNVSLHENLQNAKKLNYIKLKFINNYIKKGEQYE